MVPRPRGACLPLAWKADYIKSFCHEGGRNLLLIGIDIYAFAISAHHASVRNITCRLNECLIQCCGILHEVVSSIMVMLVSVTKKKKIVV